MDDLKAKEKELLQKQEALVKESIKKNKLKLSGAKDKKENQVSKNTKDAPQPTQFNMASLQKFI